ncbi:ABC-three component system middle component 6 [Raoultella ornithinolytica]|uniref:ABC-three component system middle component 6 n=1 Tax=Raoultella ornithinolytica TaxID=54291 RepID=UPI0039903F60
MILSNSIRPQYTIYFLGAKLIQCIQEQASTTLDSIDLFDKFKDIITSKITFVQYMYTLNWLYLLDLIELNENGDIVICF